MDKISALILAKNEAANIAECIKSVSFCDEVLVIDDFSTDDTVKIAKSLGARVIQKDMAGDWGEQQTFAIKSAGCPWVLFIDADERVTENLAQEIKEVLQKGELVSGWIKRRSVFRHNKAAHGVLRPDWVDRLFPAKGSYVTGKVHPKIVAPYKEVRLKGEMLHYTYESWEQYIRKLNNYTSLAAQKYEKEGRSCSFLKDVVLRPFWAFLKVYIFDLGFLDGKMGWALSVNHYFYTMNKYLKLYHLKKSGGKL